MSGPPNPFDCSSLFAGINGLKNTCKLSYIKISSFPSSLTKNSNRRFSKSDESLYEDWDVQSLWTSKPFSLMKLPFNPQDMTPFLSQEAIKYHYGRHHAAYVRNLNNLAEQHNELRKATLEEIIGKYEGPIYNNAAQIFNHNFFWLGIKANGGGKPYGVVKDKIEESFTSFENFREIFLKEASAHFGSGWTWLIIKDEKLKLYHGHDADNPIKSKVGHPILTIDIWEHAYYVDYKNSRSDYIKEWFNKVNWDFANYNLSIAN
ncbi:superoxide dismutase [Fe], putative [Plasmodium ovale wallikeri]|uniref:Superoxide dismutase [Fe] n=2 Tax=Plasmodium ovale TaxID=36330 RepID=A0A1C3KU99_PLAOA|nr:superoxide dismutase [Fe], putative [Plasmodium ovale wallikeri]SBT77693.1 superoxide dismutase [Fe], putative [Plasmodium ovale]